MIFLKKNIDNNELLLNAIYKNAKMGIIGIDDVKKQIDDDEFINLLNKERKQYLEVERESEDLLDKLSLKKENVNIMARIGTYMISEMNMMKENKVENVAKMMLEGTNKGIIEIKKNLNKKLNVDSKIVKLAEKLLKTEENNIEELKKYI